MKMARAASAVQFITSNRRGSDDADIFTRAEIQDMYSWLSTISLQEYLPVLLQMGVEKISHLSDLEVEDIQEAGMTRPERKRFLRKQAELAFDDALDSMKQLTTTECAASDLGERAFSSISDPESMEQALSAQNSHRSQISIISAASSCMPSSDKDDSGMQLFASPSLIQPRQTRTIDLEALESRARSICRIQRISDDCSLGFGFIYALHGQPCIITSLDVLSTRVDASDVAAVFSDGEVLTKCHLDADEMWYKSKQIGYCAVGAIFGRQDSGKKAPCASVSRSPCNCGESIVLCHWAEVDKQFTIHKAVSVSQETIQFSVRSGMNAAPGTPVFLGNMLMGLSTGQWGSEGQAAAVRADTIVCDLQRQSQKKGNKRNYDEPDAGVSGIESIPVITCPKILVQIPTVSESEERPASSSPCSILDQPKALLSQCDTHKELATSVMTSPASEHDSSARKDPASHSRRPPRPDNVLPCLSLPRMSGGSGGQVCSESKQTAMPDSRAESSSPPVQTFTVAPKLALRDSHNCVALDFQDQASAGSEMRKNSIIENLSQPPQMDGLSSSLISNRQAGKHTESCEETLSQNDTDEHTHGNHSQPSDCAVEMECAAGNEPLSARSHHDPQTEAVVEAACTVFDQDEPASNSTKMQEAKRSMLELPTAGVSATTQILEMHTGCQEVVLTALQRLDELCNDSDQNRQEALEAETLTQVLNCLDSCEANVDCHASGLSLLSSLSFSQELQFQMVEKDCIGKILHIMQVQRASVKVQFRACRALCNIGYESGKIQLKMVGEGCIPLIVSAMERYLSSSKVQAEGCGVLCNLAANNDSNYRLILEHRGISAIVQAMSMHGSQLGVLYKGCCALCSLTSTPDSHPQAVDEGAASTVIKSMLMHPDNCELLYKGCGVLANLAQTPKFAAVISKQGGVAAVVKGLTGPASDVRLECKGLRALLAICKTRETQPHVVRQGAIEATIHVMTIHEKEEEVQERAISVLSCISRYNLNMDKVAWQHQGVEAIVRAILAHPGNQTIIMEGSNTLAVLALHEGAKEKILQASILPEVQNTLAAFKMSATVHNAVKRLERALYPLDSFLDGEAPDTRDSVRRSKVKGEQRPISATLQACSRPPRPMSASVGKRIRRPASATFASGSGAMLVKDLRRALGKENLVDTNLVLEHEIEALRNEAETLRHENLKMMTGAADSIAALQGIHGLDMHATVKRRPASALRVVSPYASLAAAVPLRPPSGKSIRVSKENKGQARRQHVALEKLLLPAGRLEALTGNAMTMKAFSRPGSAPPSRQVQGGEAPQEADQGGDKLSRDLGQDAAAGDDGVLEKMQVLIASGRTNEQVARHYSLIDLGITSDQVEAVRHKCTL